MPFADVLSLHLVTFLMFSILVHATFLQQLHAWAEVCHILQSSKSPPQASYAVLAEESQAFFKHSPHTNSISNSAILRNNYISLLSDLCACVHWRKSGIAKEAMVHWAVRIASRDFKSGKKWWAGALLSEKCYCFVQKPSWKSHANLN